MGTGLCLGLAEDTAGLFHGGTEGDGALGAQGEERPLYINHLPHHHLPCVGPWNASFLIPWKSLIPTDYINCVLGTDTEWPHASHFLLESKSHHFAQKGS